MKFFSLLGVALAKECYDAVLPTGARVERGEVSAGELQVAIEEFSACAERDVNVDVTPLYETETKGTVQVSISKIIYNWVLGSLVTGFAKEVNNRRAQGLIPRMLSWDENNMWYYISRKRLSRLFYLLHQCNVWMYQDPSWTSILCWRWSKL